MKILYIADSSSWHNAKWTEYFADNNNHNVYIFSDYKPEYNKVNFHKNITLIEVPPFIRTSSRHVNKIISIPLYVKMIDDLIKKYNIDIVHCVAIYYAFLSTKIKSKVPVIYTQQGSELLVRAKTNYVYKYMAKRVFDNVDCVTGDSLAIQSAGFALGAKQKNNVIIQNGVDLNQFCLKNKLKKLNDEITFFSPRAITPLYNINIILDVLHRLKVDYNLQFKCKFTFGFGDEYLSSYKNKVKELGLEENIEWIGYVLHGDMIKIYQESDLVFSLPSSDSSPKSVYEAMAIGVPVVVSNLPWTKEKLEHNKHALIVNLSDVDAIAEQVYNLLTNDASCDDMVLNARNLVENNFSYNVEMNKMEKLMERIIDEYN
ncbi:hypothetical protein JS87_15985 [Vibrio vulnificus]|uniref:glycosyltransferase family 4 protein n=1 Tax=Vibrio vulnificus TaxID=672 RepID=UPI000501C042|nr:glycosyltransferase family 4 protein [Vibrio vulnificus]KFK49732.1 hypothetical protein JS87_15985 [Vibrio vulnificus]HAT8499798.1 glycosyltransferase [Vibrio vulnificus]HDY8227273.1 glycosyltransferase family 4 protein [Vibrio vulnificus]